MSSIVKGEAFPLVPDYILKKLILIYGFSKDLYIKAKNPIDTIANINFEEYYAINTDWLNKFKQFYNYEKFVSLMNNNNNFNYKNYEDIKRNIKAIIDIMKPFNIQQKGKEFPNELNGKIFFIPKFENTNNNIYYFKDFYIVNNELKEEICQDIDNPIKPNYSLKNNMKLKFFIGNNSFYINNNDIGIGNINKDGRFISKYHIKIDSNSKVSPEEEISRIIKIGGIDKYINFKKLEKNRVINRYEERLILNVEMDIEAKKKKEEEEDIKHDANTNENKKINNINNENKNNNNNKNANDYNHFNQVSNNNATNNNSNQISINNIDVNNLVDTKMVLGENLKNVFPQVQQNQNDNINQNNNNNNINNFFNNNSQPNLTNQNHNFQQNISFPQQFNNNIQFQNQFQNNMNNNFNISMGAQNNFNNMNNNFQQNNFIPNNNLSLNKFVSFNPNMISNRPQISPFNNQPQQQFNFPNSNPNYNINNIFNPQTPYPKTKKKEGFYYPNLTSLKNLNHHPMIGLINLGKTCYMNSVLQCFSNLYPITNYFLNPKNQEQIKNHMNAMGRGKETLLCFSYKELIDNLWKGTPNKPFSPITFRKNMAKLNDLFGENSAGDSKDFATFLLMTFHSELNLIVPNPQVQKLNFNVEDKINPYEQNQVWNAFWSDFCRNNYSIISHYFYGITQGQFECQVCKMRLMQKGNYLSPIKYNYENYFYIEFPLDKVRQNIALQNNNLNFYQNINCVNVYDCFNYHQKLSSINGYCEKCGLDNAKINSMNIIYSPSLILMLIFNRGKGLQFNIKVDFQDKLYLNQIMRINNQFNNHYYELQGVVKHLGDNSSYGHFIAYCRSAVPKCHMNWYCYNDQTVVQVNNWQDIVDKGDTYILFYELKEYKQ